MDVKIYFEIFGEKKSIVIKDVYSKSDAEGILRDKIEIHKIEILSGEEPKQEKMSDENFYKHLKDFLGMK